MWQINVSFVAKFLFLLLLAQAMPSQTIEYKIPVWHGQDPIAIPLDRAMYRSDLFSALEVNRMKSITGQCDKSAIPLSLVIRNVFEENIRSVLIRYVFYSEQTVRNVGVTEVHYFARSGKRGALPPGSIAIQAPSSQLTELFSKASASSVEDSTNVSRLCLDYASRLTPTHSGDRLSIEVDSIVMASGRLLGEDVFGVLRRNEDRRRALREVLRLIQEAEVDKDSLTLKLAKVVKEVESRGIPSLRQNIDFYPLELSKYSKYALNMLEAGSASVNISQSIQSMLESLDGSLQIRRMQ